MSNQKFRRQPARQKPVPHSGAGEVRIIGGKWKKSKLPVPQIEGLRPTPNRIRETLFNWLGQTLDGWHCLDLFAGTGALGFEAASRGAAQVTLVETNRQLILNLQTAKNKLGAEQIEIVHTDAMVYLKSLPEQSFELVFIDPPYQADLFLEALTHAQRVVVPQGLIYLEADHPIKTPVGLICYRQGEAGDVYYYLFQKEHLHS